MEQAPELAEIRGQIRSLDSEADLLCEGLSEEALNWKPSLKRWSIAENLIHLHTTAMVFLPSADQAISSAREQGLLSRGPFPLGIKDRIFVWYVEPPPKIRLPAPKPLRPAAGQPQENALSKFLQANALVIQRVDAADGLDLIRATVTSPLASFIRMSLLGFFSVYTAHGRRHLYQAAAVRRELPGHSHSSAGGTAEKS